MLWAFLRTIWPNRFRSRSESSFELPIQLDNFGTAVGGCGSTDNLCTRRTLYRERRILQKSSSKNDLCVFSSRFYVTIHLYPDSWHHG